MLSDALFDAIQNIEQYETDDPETYDDLKPQIAQVKETLRALMWVLDSPPDSPLAKCFPDCVTALDMLEKRAKKGIAGVIPIERERKIIERVRRVFGGLPMGPFENLTPRDEEG
jgi:hypothetical protein